MSDLTRLAQQFRDEDEQQQSPAFGELADRFRQEDAANANAALFATEQVRPDDAAQARRVASQFNTSFEFASANREELTAAELNNRLSATLRNSSALAGFMAVPENAAVARDDTDALAELEAKVRRANRNAQFDVGNILQDFGVGAGSLFGRGIRGLGTEMEAIGRRTFSETVQSEDFDLSRLVDRLLAFGAKGLEMQGRFTREEGHAIQSAIEPFATPAEERGFANEVSSALGQIVSGVGVAAIPYVGVPAAGGLFFGAGVDEQAQRMEAAGVEPSENLLALTGGGAIEAGLETLRVGRILDALPPSVRQRVARETIGRIFRQGAEEASEEVIAGVLQNVLETTYNEDAEIFNLDEAIQEGGTAFTASAILQGVIEVALPGRARVARAQEAATELQEERDAAREAQLHTRDLGALRDFMNRLDPDAEVHVNARMLMQSENASEAAEALGLTADEIAEAAVGDGDVAVPRRVFTTIESDQMFAELVQITRERPDAAMLAEANEEIETIIRDYAERVSTQQVSESDIQTVSDTIYEQLTQRIGHTPDAARAQADVIAAGISRIALDAGMTPEQLFEQIGLQVRRPEQTPQDVELEAALNDLRRGAIPDEAQAYGTSLQDLAREAGIDIRGGELNLRDEGQLDEFGERATEEGFFMERPDVAAIEDALLGDELRIAENRNVDLARRREVLLDLQELLDRRGVPIETATVADVQQGVAEDAQSRELGQDSPEFREWFGDSKVVDENGEPLVVYHGTPTPFGEFDEARLGGNTGAPSASQGFFFTDSPELASAYAGFQDTFDAGMRAVNAVTGGLLERFGSRYSTPEGGNVRPTFLRITNPLVVDQGGKRVREEAFFDTIERAKAEGHDGVIIRNTFDGAFNGQRGPQNDVYVAFDTDQIRGTFDRGDARILNQSVPDTEAFREWAGTDQVIEPEGINAHDFRGEGPFVLRVFHGTTHDFEAFDATRGEILGRFGRVNYFTSSEADAQQNYAGEGPDLINRIEARSEQLFDRISDMAEEVGMDRIVGAVQRAFPHVRIPDNTDVNDLADHIARAELTGGQSQVLELYVRTDNPFVIGEALEWIEFVDNAEIEQQAIAQVAEDEGVTPEEVEASRDDYEDQIDEARWEIEADTPHKLVEAIQTVAARHDVEASALAGEVHDLGSEARPKDIERLLRDHDDFAFADNDKGEMIGSQLVAEVIEELGYDSIILKDADRVFSGMDMGHRTAHVHVFHADRTNIKSVDNVGTFDPSDPRILRQDQFNRGSITIPDAGVLSDENVVIRLGEAHDLSTFAHEGAHLFLELYRELALQSPAIAARYAKIEEFLGIESGGEVTTDQHELWARTFEAYLREGKAPSIELRGAFQRFKSWLARIYRSLLSIGETKLNDEARQIFDAILATEEDITANREAERMEMSTTYSGLMDEQTVEKYGEAARAARGEAEEKALQVHTEQIAREHQREWRDARRQARKEEEANYWAEPANAAFWLLTRGTKKTGETPRYLEGAKLDRAAVEELIGPSGVQALPKSKTRVYTSKGGVVPDQVAPEFGFMSGHEMLLAMMESRAQGKPEQVINQRADALTRERLGDPRRDGTAERVAREAVYSDKAVKLLRVEADFLASKALRRPMPAQSIKAAADRIINTRSVKETVKPGTYALRAQRAADKALRLAAAEKWAEALEMKQTQILNAELARRAFKARDEVARINRVFRRVRTKKYDAKKFHPRFIEHVKALLSLFENGEGDRAALEKFADDVNAGQFAGALLMPVGATKEPTAMTLDEMRDLRDALLSGEHGARLNGELAEQEFQARNAEYAEQINVAWGDRKRKGFSRDAGMGEQIKKIARKSDAAIMRWSFLVGLLQGGETGSLTEQLETRQRAAVNDAIALQTSLDDQLSDILEKHGITIEELNRELHLPEIGSSKFSRLIALALNTGNEGNKSRVDTDPTIQGGLSGATELLNRHMEKRHWDAVQEIWDLVDTLWPQVSEVQRKSTGVTPAKVDASQVVTPFGVYRGGYYPIKYDPDHQSNSDIAAQSLDELWGENAAGFGAKAQTRQGHTVERENGVRRALNLDLSVALDHFRDVSRDIHMRDVINENWRLLNDKKSATRQAISETWGKEYVDAMELILKRTASGTQPPANIYEKLARTLRINSSIAILGWKVTTAALAPVSYLQTVVPRYGLRRVAGGLAEFFGGFLSGKPADTQQLVNMILEKSVFMRERTKTLNREAHERIRRTPIQSRWSKFQGSGFWLMSWFEIYTTSGPLWLGVYRDAIDNGSSEKDAVAAADRAVVETQGSGLSMDQSPMQGGNELERWFTYMWGYMSGYYGTVRSDFGAQRNVRQKTLALLKHLVLINAAASMFELLIREFGISDEEEDPYLVRVLNQMRRNAAGLVPGSSLVLDNRYGDGPAIQNFGTKVSQAMDSYVSLGEDFAEDGQVDAETVANFARRNMDVIGFGVGAPGTVQVDQVLRTLTEDDDPTVIEALITGPDDDN